MKKLINKNTLFGFIIGLIITSSVGVIATTLYYSNEVSYTPEDNNWNVDNVKDALDSLYSETRSNEKFLLYATYRSNIVREGIMHLYTHTNGSASLKVASDIIKLNDDSITFNKDCKISITGLISTYSTTPYFNVYVNSNKVFTASGNIDTQLEMKAGDVLEMKTYNQSAMWYYTGVTITNIA